MIISIISMQPASMFRTLHNLSLCFSAKIKNTYYISSQPIDIDQWESSNFSPKLDLVELSGVNKIVRLIPFLRANYHGIFMNLMRIKPDFILAQHGFVIPSIAYKAISGRKVRVAAYFDDYAQKGANIKLVKLASHMLDAYVDVCDVRLGWRQRDWPRMTAAPFVIRQAPLRREGAAHVDHSGPTRVIFTSSRYVLGLDRSRLSRFFARLCEHGIHLDWYLPGAEDLRETARSLLSHPLYAVRDPVEKSRLMETLGRYDVGLHWAPMAEEAHDPPYFQTAASNKIGEYIAAGLVVAHAGNPGLSYLPEAVTAVFDPTDPIAGADQLAALLSDRTTVERKRRAALQYHLDEMNFEAQARPFIDYAARNSTR